MTDPRSFGSWLRRERERRSVTLRTIADRTKIGAGLLESLERGDVSRWPGGIYRRAFVRSYAEVVGLDPDLVVANFERVFPADPSAVPAAPAVPAVSQHEEMRLSLVAPAVAGVTPSAVKTACRDVACIATVAVIAYVVAGAVGFWCAAAVAALAFHLTRVLGLRQVAFWRRAMEQQAAIGGVRGEVVSFTEQHARSTSRRARARRMLADLSAAASSAATSGRRRAARS